MRKVIQTPLLIEEVRDLRAGMKVAMEGVLYTARDEAHRRMVEAISRGEELPILLENQVLFYAGPTPAPPGRMMGSIGPTTSSRMDQYTPALLERGLRGMIGKGNRSPLVVEAIKKYGGVYFLAIGGIAALLGKKVQKCELVAYPDLGPEAIYRLEVKDFPLLVGIDCLGNNLYPEE